MEPSISLEAELAAIAERIEPGRNAQIAVRYWGWDGRGGATLESTGREFAGITRERVRQLCERLAAKVAAVRPETPVLDQALILAAHTAPTTAHELARRLADAHISARPFDPAGLRAAAEIVGRYHVCTLETIKGVRVVLPEPPDPMSDARAVIAAIVDTARTLVRKGGAGRVRDVTGQVAAELAVWVDDNLVTAMVSDADDFVWLERRSGWFYLPSVAKNAVVSRIIKVLSVTGSVRVRDLHVGIRRDGRVREFAMPEYILAELCERIPGVALDGDVVYAVQELDPDEVLETTELMLLRLLREHGGAMQRHELEALCLEEGMKASSFNNRIAYSPIIEDRGRGEYGLRGLSGHAGFAAARDDDSTPRPGELGHFQPARRR